jgi:hypothetical protein
VALKNRRHQTVYGSANGRKLLKNCSAFGTVVERLLKSGYLTFYAAHTG